MPARSELFDADLPVSPPRSLLVTLAILKALCAECRQDISLFARSVVVCVDYALASLSNDLEVAARSASVVSLYMITRLDLFLIGEMFVELVRSIHHLHGWASWSRG